jgi:hypothetical protein
MMLIAATVTLFLGVDAECKPLKEVCAPLGVGAEVRSMKPEGGARQTGS